MSRRVHSRCRSFAVGTGLGRLVFVLALASGAAFAQQAFPNGYSFYDDYETQGVEMYGADLGAFNPPSSYYGTQNCTNGTYGVSSTNPHSGSYSLFNTVNGGGNVTSCGIYAQFATHDPVSVRVFFYLASGFTITGTMRLFTVQNASFSSAAVNITRSGSNIVLNQTCGGSGTHNISVGAWHSVETAYNVGSQTMTTLLDGSTEISGRSCSLAATPIYINIGAVDTSGTESGTVYFDDLVVSTSSIGSPSANMIVRHPSTFGRTGLPLLLTMWGASSSDTILVSIDGAQVATYSAPVNGMTIAIPCCTQYSVGTHTLLVQDEGSGGVISSSWTETITSYSTSYNSFASLDGYNNLSIAGTKVFPIFPFILNADSSCSDQTGTNFWIGHGCSTAYATELGWQTSYQSNYTAANFKTDVDARASDSPGTPSIGPDGAGDSGCRYANCTGGTFPTTQNSSIATYASTMATDTNLLGYTWMDEPEINSVNGNAITSAALTEWTATTHTNDANHMVFTNLYGYTPVSSLEKGYFVPNVITEVYADDNYPVSSQCSANPETIATWIALQDEFMRLEYGLAPWMPILEGSGQPSTGCPASGNQLRMEAWLGTIHGAKGITWYVDAVSGSTSDELTGMSTFVSLSQNSSVLPALTCPSPEITVTTNQTNASTDERVDAMATQCNNTLTVFAQRLTDIGLSGGSLSTTMTISGSNYTGTASVVGENRSVNVSSGVITDNFVDYATHIYQILETSDPPAPPTGLNAQVQ